MLTIMFFENWNLEWYRHSNVNSNDRLILQACLFHPVFLSDVFGDNIGVTSKQSADSALSNCQSNFCLHEFLGRKLGTFFSDTPGILQLCSYLFCVTLCSMREQYYVFILEFPSHSVNISFIFLASRKQ